MFLPALVTLGATRCMAMQKRRSAAEWGRLVTLQAASGERVGAFARRHGLCVATLRWWQSRLRGQREAEAAPARFIELVEPAALPVMPTHSCRVVVGAVELRFDAVPDVEYVVALARAYERRGP